MKRRTILFSAAVALAASLVVGNGVTKYIRAEEEETVSDTYVAIDEKNFPDANFRKYVKEFDLNKDDRFSSNELEEVSCISCSEMEISTLKGIEFFTSTKELFCHTNKIQELDLSKNAKLEKLFCSHNQIKSLDLENNKSLSVLICNDNQIKSLDVRACEQLTELECTGNHLETLYTANAKLERVLCYENDLKSLDVSGDANLKFLWCYSNQLEKLEISKNTKLSVLYCNFNALKDLDVSKNTELTSLVCYDNKLIELDVSKNLHLNELSCERNQVKALDVSNNTALEVLRCYENKLTSLDISKNKDLTELDCSNNALNKLDVSVNTKLVSLKCDKTQLTSLDVSMLKELEILFSAENQLTSIDVGNCPNLTTLWIESNQISELDISNNLKLEALDCNNNQILSLDVSKHTKLLDLMCANNKISKLEVSNSPDLLMLYCGDNQISSLDLKNNPELLWLSCDANQISELDLSNNLNIAILLTHMNKISSIDLRKHDVLFERISRADEWEEFDTYYVAKLIEQVDHGSRGYISLSGTFSYDKSTNVLLKDNSLLPKPSVTPVPTGKPDVTPTPVPSTGSIADFVERLYTVALNRAAEPEGKEYWVKEIENGNKTGGDCAHFFLIEAEEFRNRGLNEDDFVETLYLTFFDRASEPNGKAFWVGQLKNGAMTRNQVISGFIDSTEWCNVCANYGVKSGAPNAKAEFASKNAINFATRLYTCCLGRAPEEAGLKYWSLALTNLEQTGCSAAKQFFKSDEFTNAKVKDENYILKLYATFMDREPESSEMTYWYDSLQNGTQTRDSILAFFGSSEEFTNICKKYGIDRGTI